MQAGTSARQGPPRWERFPEGYGAWLVTRYSEVRIALVDKRLTRAPHRAAAARADAGLPIGHGGSVGRGTNLLDCDPPRHTVLRKAINPEFATRKIARTRPHIEHLAHEFVNRFCERGTCELVEEFALPLTVTTLCEFIGIPFQDWEKFATWVREVHVVDPTPAGRGRIAEAVTAIDAYFEEVLRRNRAEPGSPADDVLSNLIAVDREARLSDDDIVAMGRGLLVGGYESSASLIVTGMLALLTHPGALRTLQASPTLIPTAVEEFLRYEPPFPRVQERYALEDVEFGGVPIRQGQPVVLDLAAANRDPERFRHPDKLNITDVDRGHVAFGPGIHHCLGAALARLEAEVAIRTLLARLPNIALHAPHELHWPTGILAAPSTLPVRFDPVAPSATSGAHRP